MKHIIHLSFLLAVLFSSAQAPQAINYQAVARNSSGSPLANQLIGYRISVTDGSTDLYQQTGSATTNPFGLFTVKIGLAGTFSNINWESGAKYIKVEIDSSGGSSFTSMGEAQLLSVPYALYSNKAGGVTGTPPVGHNLIAYTNNANTDIVYNSSLNSPFGFMGGTRITFTPSRSKIVVTGTASGAGDINRETQAIVNVRVQDTTNNVTVVGSSSVLNSAHFNTSTFSTSIGVGWNVSFSKVYNVTPGVPITLEMEWQAIWADGDFGLVSCNAASNSSSAHRNLMVYE